MTSRRFLAIASGLVLLFLSGMVLALPVANAQTAVVVVTIPAGSGVQSGAPGYTPDNVTVVIGVNNTVMWTNNDTQNSGTDHTVTSVSVPSGAASFDSGIMAEGANFTQTFTVPGTYEYHCTIHSWMTGSVLVLASTKTAPEFPSSALALTLFAVMAGVVLVTSRLRGTLPSVAAHRTS